MCQRAYRDPVDAGFRDLADIFETHASRRLDDRALVHKLHALGQLNWRHVVEQHDVGIVRDRRLHLLDGVALDLDARMCRRYRARSRDRPPDIAVHRCQVVVLDQDRARQIHAVVLPPAAPHRVLLQRPPARQGLPRIENLGVGSAHRGYELRGQRGDAGQVLHEVQRDALRREHSARVTTDEQHRRPSLDRLAVGFDRTRDGLGVHLPECLECQQDTAHGAGPPRDDRAARATRTDDGGDRGDVVERAVLFQRHPDERRDVGRRQRKTDYAARPVQRRYRHRTRPMPRWNGVSESGKPRPAIVPVTWRVAVRAGRRFVRLWLVALRRLGIGSSRLVRNRLNHGASAER